MANKRRSEVSIVSTSKTVVKWKSKASWNSINAGLSITNNAALIPSATMIALGSGAHLGVLAVIGGYTLATNFLSAKTAHRTDTSDVLGKRTKVTFRDSLKLPGSKRKFIESYFISHPYPFKGLITKEQEVDELQATHLVTSYLVNGFLGQRIEQEITEVQGFMWDKTLDSIESMMTLPPDRITKDTKIVYTTSITASPTRSNK
jgi:hypothetical protein